MEKSRGLGASENVCHEIAREGGELLEHLFDEDVRTGEQPRTVVLQGAAGVGKTTLARMLMLDWARVRLYQQKFTCVFYLDAKEVNQLRERSFAQMISKAWPSSEGPIERVLSQPSGLLFVTDGFDKLNFAFEEPECVLCKDWTQVHPVSFLMSSLLRKVMLPQSSLLVTTKLTACDKLKLVLKRQRSVRLPGMSEDAERGISVGVLKTSSGPCRRAAASKTTRRFSACAEPPLCAGSSVSVWSSRWRGHDVTVLCRTTPAPFACCVSSLLTGAGGGSPALPSETQLMSLCHLAARGVWT